MESSTPAATAAGTSPLRVASFLPSGTTIAYALGLGHALVGVTHECEFPPEAKSKPSLLRPALDSAALSSEAIDAEVKKSIKEGYPLYAVDTGPLLAAGGCDVALTQEICDVCAAGGKLVKAALDGMPPSVAHPRIVELTARSLDGLYADIKAVASACGVPARGVELVTSLKRRVAAVAAAVGAAGDADGTNTAAAPSLERPVRVVCLEWLDPLYNAGHWVPDAVARAGGVDPLGINGAYSVGMTWETFVASAPDVVVLMPCGFDADRAVREGREHLVGKPGWADLPAVCAGRVWAVNGFRLFSGASPALVDGLEILARILHPAAFLHGSGALSPSPAEVEALLRRDGFGPADVVRFAEEEEGASAGSS